MDTITCPTTKTDLYWRAENIDTYFKPINFTVNIYRFIIGMP